MPIRYDDARAVFDGHVAVDDAEPLAQWLAVTPAGAVDLAACDHVHAAVLQVLMALRPPVAAAPADPWLAGALAAPDRVVGD